MNSKSINLNNLTFMKGLTIIGVNEAPDGTKTLVVNADGTGPGGGMRELPIPEELFQMWLTRGSIEEGPVNLMREAAISAGHRFSKLWVPVNLG